MISYWEKTAYLHEKDLIIIGAGIVGLQAGITFKKQFPDADVLIIERGIMPGGASTKNAGFACFGSVTELMDDLSKHGEEATFSLVKDRYAGLLELRKTLGDKTIDFEMCGGFEIFNNSDSFKSACDSVDYLNAALKRITGENEVYSIGTTNDLPSIKNSLEGYLHSGKMVRALTQMAQKLGVSIWNNTEVTGLSAHSVTIENEITIPAKAVLAATNAYTFELLAESEIVPARGYIFVTNPISHNWKGTFHYDEGFIYFRDLGERMLIGGARNADFHAEQTTKLEINETIKHQLIAFTRHTLQLKESWHIEQEWTGIMGFGKSKRPLIAKMHNGVFAAAGLAGMGVALGMQTGRQAVQLIQNNL